MTYLSIEILLARSSRNKMAENLEKDNVSTSRKSSTSLVTDVLLKSGRLEKEDINSCVKKTLQKSEEVKVSFSFIEIWKSTGPVLLKLSILRLTFIIKLIWILFQQKAHMNLITICNLSIFRCIFDPTVATKYRNNNYCLGN